MNEQDRRYLAAAADRIKRLLGARSATPLRAGALSPDLQAFAESFDNLLEHMEVLRRFTITLASGDLSYEAPPRNHLLDPLKQLQSNLRHLTWQTQQIAAGSLDQHAVSYTHLDVYKRQGGNNCKQRFGMDQQLVESQAVYQRLERRTRRTYRPDHIDLTGSSRIEKIAGADIGPHPPAAIFHHQQRYAGLRFQLCLLYTSRCV